MDVHTSSGVKVMLMPAEKAVLPPGRLRYHDYYRLLDLIAAASIRPDQRWDPPNFLLSGPKGVGKSLAIAFLAQEWQIPYYSFDCSEETRDRHLRGGYIAADTETPFVFGVMANAIAAANRFGRAFLVLEELGALPSNEQKLVNSVTDFRKRLEMPELSERLELDPEKILFVFATTNLGYSGTYELNEDLKSRFIEIEIPYPDAVDELQMMKISMGDMFDQGNVTFFEHLIRMAQHSRQGETEYALSPRDIVQLGHQFVRLRSAGETLFLLLQKFETKDRVLMAESVRDITGMMIPKNLLERKQMIATGAYSTTQ